MLVSRLGAQLRLHWEAPVGMGGRAEASPRHPRPEPCTPPAEESNVVDAILFLLSDRSGMTTGATVPVDGGFLAT